MTCALARRSRSFTADRAGVAAIEFAIMAPVFLLILFAITSYGLYFAASHSVQQLAADAARASIAGLSATERQSLVESFINSNGAAYPFIEARRLSVETHDSSTDNSQFVVRVDYDAAGLPIWSLFDGLPLPGRTISQTSTIRIGGR